MLRLLEYQKTDHPFYNENMAVHLYSIEELCYFMEANTYLIDPSWVNEELFTWLKREFGEEKLAADLRVTLRTKKDVFACAELIFDASGLYAQQDLVQVMGLLDQMRGRTKMERRKMSGDLFLEAGKYRQAAYTYLELLEDCYAIQMTEELRGNIYHNLGVVYAKMFLFPEATRLFAKAYALHGRQESKDAYLYAMNFMDDSDETDDQAVDLNFSIMRDALAHLSETEERQEYMIERKAASAAASAFDWKSAQEKLIGRWTEEYKEML